MLPFVFCAKQHVLLYEVKAEMSRHNYKIYEKIFHRPGNCKKYRVSGLCSPLETPQPSIPARQSHAVCFDGRRHMVLYSAFIFSGPVPEYAGDPLH